MLTLLSSRLFLDAVQYLIARNSEADPRHNQRWLVSFGVF